VCALDDEGDGHEDDPSRDELPRGCGDDVDGRGPLLRQHEAEGGEHDGEQPGEQAQRVEGPVEPVLEHEQADAEEADEAGSHGNSAGPVTRQQPGHSHGDHRGSGDERRAETAREAVGGEEEERVEEADVEAAEDEGAPPPVTSREASQPKEHEQADGKRTERRGEEGTAGGQPELRDGIRRAPDRRGERRQRDGRPASSITFHGR
jgi:hypothetical protein